MIKLLKSFLFNIKSFNSVRVCESATVRKKGRVWLAMDAESNQKLPVSSSSQSQERLKKGPKMTRKGAYAAISYMASAAIHCAVLLIMFNKAALSSYNFPSTNVITLFQMLSSCTLLYAMKCWKIISFTTEPQITTNNPVTLLVTMASVRGINVPMYTTLRRTTVAFTMIVEYILTRQKHSYPVVGSVGIIILGAVVAGARDLSFDAYSYGVVFVANICTAIYLASIAHIGKSSGLSTFGLMWCNGIICGPILLFWTSISGELGRMINFPYLFSHGFQVLPFHEKNCHSDSTTTSILQILHYMFLLLGIVNLFSSRSTCLSPGWSGA
ncbi:unnamed protein product [Prunus armeniaca]|uniref:Sugar phosphate transporter domain-containing protein n=1 Tax=Prunus armeniaca TaxID=36596 RepID=A0A6J5VRW8_PRUAR|nr:unnamed protein product [Prunus armeniaca]